MGHDPAIMVKNYLTNPDLDAHFKHETKATRNPTRKQEKTGETTRNLVRVREAEIAENKGISRNNEDGDWAMRDSKDAVLDGTMRVLAESDAQSDALPADLAEIVRVWPTLSPKARREILAVAGISFSESGPY